MPGTVLVGSRYYQEVAEDIALDRAEHEGLGVTVEVEAGTFEECLSIVETTPLEPGEESLKWYAPGVGLIKDNEAELVDFTDPSAPVRTRRDWESAPGSNDGPGVVDMLRESRKNKPKPKIQQEGIPIRSGAGTNRRSLNFLD